MFDRELIFNRTMLSVWLTSALIVMGYVAIMPFLPLYVAELGVTEPSAVVFWSGAIFSAFGVASFFTGPLMGLLADRVGPKRVIMWSYGVAAVCFVVMAMVNDVFLLVLVRFIQGVFGAGAPAATSAIVANSFPRPKLGQAFGIYQTSMTVSSGIGPLVGGVVAESAGIRGSLYMAAGLMVAGLLLALFFIPNVRLAPQGQSANPFVSLKQIATSRVMFAVWVASAMLAASMFFVLPVYPLFLAEIGVTQVASTIGFLMAIAAVSSTLLTPLAGTLADRWGHRSMLVAGLATTGILTGGTALIATVGQLAVLRVVAAGCSSGIGPATAALAAGAAPKRQLGGSFGMLASANTIGVVIGPMLGGVAVSLGGLRGAFVATGLLMILAAVWASTVIKTSPDTSPAPLSRYEQAGK